jgi:hypothetical protein
MKAALILITLGLVFLIAFVTRIDTKSIGPTSANEVDDLQIQEAYLDHAENALVLITRDRWTRVPLTPVIETNRQLRTAAPRDSNSVHWTSFIAGRPSADQIRQMEPVAITTDRFASFAYYHYPPDGRPRHNSEETATMPAGYRAALYRSSAEYAQDNKTQFKSYVLATALQQADGLFGVQFFYHPDYSRSIKICLLVPVCCFSWWLVTRGFPGESVLVVIIAFAIASAVLDRREFCPACHHCISMLPSEGHLQLPELSHAVRLCPYCGADFSYLPSNEPQRNA